MESPLLQPRADAGHFLRPYVLGATVYIAVVDVLFLFTHGKFSCPESLAGVYMVLMAAYAGGHEIQRLIAGAAPVDDAPWLDRLHRGGPFITLWLLLYGAAVSWRIADPSVPMPPELTRITNEILLLFLGTYTLRQVRRRRTASRRNGDGSNDPTDASAADEMEKQSLLDYLQKNGPSTPKVIRPALGLPRRTLTRLLADLTEQGLLEREGRYANDPATTYRLKP